MNNFQSINQETQAFPYIKTYNRPVLLPITRTVEYSTFFSLIVNRIKTVVIDNKQELPPCILSFLQAKADPPKTKRRKAKRCSRAVSRRQVSAAEALATIQARAMAELVERVNQDSR